MTAPGDPDILQVILDRYPELTLRDEGFSGWTLLVNADDVKGQLWTRTRPGVTLLAQAFDGFRNAQQHAPRRCRCGASYALHHWDTPAKKNPFPPTGCEDYVAAEVAR